MLRATLKSLLSRKLRLVLSALAVVLGVMFVSGAFVLSSTLNKSFDSLFASVYEGTDVTITGKSNVANGPTDAIPASALEKAKSTAGVKTATGSVFADGARAIGKNGKVVAGGGQRFGANWTGETDIVKMRSGKAPSADNEIAVNQAFADASGYKIGDSVGVLTLEPKKQFTIVGIFGYSGDRGSIAGEQTIAFTTPVAQQLMLGEKDVYSSVDVTAADGVSATKLRDDLRSSLGDGFVVKTGEEMSKAQSDSVKGVFDVIRNILLGFAGVALLVGIFLIINTFSIIVAQRTKELALMRAMGASGGQVIGSVIVEAIIIGLIASVLGLAAGIGVGAALVAVVGSVIPSAGLVIPLSAVIAAFSIGILVTVVAALFPALRASRIPPIAAMRDAANTTKPLTTITIVGGVVTALGVAGLWVALAGGAGDNTLALLLGGVLFAFIGVALLTPMISQPVVSVLGQFMSWSMPGKLGRRNSARNPRRTAITSAALMIGIALVIGVSVVATSFKASITKAIDTGLQAELIIAGEQTGPMPPTFDPSVLDKIKNTSGVRSVTGIYFDGAKINDKDGGFVYAVSDVKALGDIMGLKATSGSVDALSGNQLILDERTAKDANLSVGGTVKVQTTRGEAVTYTVAGVFKESQVLRGYVLPQAAAANFLAPNPAQAYVRLDSGASVSAAKDKIDTYLADSPEVTVADRSSYVKQQTSFLDILLGMIQVLLALAIIIAVLGVINTLALSMIERTRELGLLRAVGMSRPQIMGMVTVESVVISLFGTLLGIGVGVGLGAAIVRALKDEGLSTLALPWTQIVVYLILAVVIGVVAGVIPAIRAARTDVLRAISYE
ncbi:FtsX-like permease family protein [Longispora sp. NPDC051575]|uniref:ABC transporter permease n=1 Tax=Longispora sp. NPDC051575 TaxID=3154943 RepID=UPI00343B7A41